MKGFTSKNRVLEVCSLISRILIAITVVIIALMPLTEYLWHFDQFLQGGQDFELSVLAILTVLCLVLVLFQHGQKDLEVLIRLARHLAFVFHRGEPGIPGSFRGLISSLHAEPFPSAALGMYTIPLQI